MHVGVHESGPDLGYLFKFILSPCSMMFKMVLSEVISCHFGKKYFTLPATNDSSYCFNRETE